MHFLTSLRNFLFFFKNRHLRMSLWGCQIRWNLRHFGRWIRTICRFVSLECRNSSDLRLQLLNVQQLLIAYTDKKLGLTLVNLAVPQNFLKANFDLLLCMEACWVQKGIQRSHWSYTFHKSHDSFQIFWALKSSFLEVISPFTFLLQDTFSRKYHNESCSHHPSLFLRKMLQETFALSLYYWLAEE